MEQANGGVDLAHFYTFGEVYETLDTCAELETLLGRLRRQKLIGDDAFLSSMKDVANVRGCLEAHLDAKAPSQHLNIR